MQSYRVVHYDGWVNARQVVQIRLAQNGLKRLDETAGDWHVTRSDVIRGILANALADPKVLAAVKARVVTEQEV